MPKWPHLILVALVVSSMASAADVHFYGPRGDLQGTATTSGDTTRFYDDRGSYQGQTQTSGDTTRFYDARGSYQGQMQGASREILDNQGRRLFGRPSQ